MSILDDDLIIGKSLTLEERSVLMTAEAEIDEFRRSFVKAGLALTTIRDGRLYRETHDTFDKYCQERWGLKHSQVYRLIDSAKVFQILSSEEEISSSSQSNSSPVGEIGSSLLEGSSPVGEIGSSLLEGSSPVGEIGSSLLEGSSLKGNILPESERQVRPLTKLKKPELVRQAWESACNATNGKPTADDVVEAVNRIVGYKPKRQPKQQSLSAEEKDNGASGWQHDGANRYFGVNIHDQEVGMEIVLIAQELGRSNAAAISKSVEAYRLLPLQSAEIAELKEKLVEKDHIIAEKDQIIAEKDQIIAEKDRIIRHLQK